MTQGEPTDRAEPTMNADDERTGLWFVTYLHVHRLGGKRWTAPPKKYPTMPRSTWRSLAAICFAIGAVIGAFVGRGDAALTVAAAIVIGLIAVPVGMWAIETVWLRRRAP